MCFLVFLCLEIAKLGVIADRQNQGIGKAIVEYIIESSYMFNERYIIGFLELNSKKYYG